MLVVLRMIIFQCYDNMTVCICDERFCTNYYINLFSFQRKSLFTNLPSYVTEYLRSSAIRETVNTRCSTTSKTTSMEPWSAHSRQTFAPMLLCKGTDSKASIFLLKLIIPKKHWGSWHFHFALQGWWNLPVVSCCLRMDRILYLSY